MSTPHTLTEELATLAAELRTLGKICLDTARRLDGDLHHRSLGQSEAYMTAATRLDLILAAYKEPDHAD